VESLFSWAFAAVAFVLEGLLTMKKRARSIKISVFLNCPLLCCLRNLYRD
jgi:hypothetical protein